MAIWRGQPVTAGSFTPFPETNLALRRKRRCGSHQWSIASPREAPMPGASTWRRHGCATRARMSFFLTVGDPDQAPPAPVIDATIDALRRHRTGYSSIIGYPKVREAIATRFERRTGRPCNADNVVVTPGAQGGVYCALQCLAGPDGEVIVPEAI